MPIWSLKRSSCATTCGWARIGLRTCATRPVRSSAREGNSPVRPTCGPGPIRAGSAETGFDVGGYTLVNVRWFQIETDTTPNDFLDSDLLPVNYPSDVGRLALDFNPPGDPDTMVTVFFDDFVATPSP